MPWVGNWLSWLSEFEFLLTWTTWDNNWVDLTTYRFK